MTTESVPATTPPPIAQPAPAAPAVPRRRAARIRLRPIIISVVILAILAGISMVGYNYWHDATLYISTDDALVDANMTSVTSPGSGVLSVWPLKTGTRVHMGQDIGFVTAAPGSTSAVSFHLAAPIDGTIIRVDAKEGQLIAPSQPLAYIADLDHMRITAFIDETEIREIKPGQVVDITVDATGKEIFHGTVSEILPATAAQFSLLPSTDRGTSNFTKVTQRIEVHIALQNPQSSSLFLGESANVRIHRQ